jgi:glycosyltransferase involved in cell wall biosynthesis
LSVCRQVSVIIPVFNGERTIRRAVDSVVAQTLLDLEIIIIDDGSTDHTNEFITQFVSDRLRVIRHPQNRGSAAARNTGITAAQGRWIAFLDSDDTWMPDKLTRQVALLEQVGPSAAACSTGYYLHKAGRDLTISLNLPPEQFHREVLFGCMISPGTTLIVDRRVFDEIGMFDESFRRLEDWDWLLRFSERHSMVFIPEPLADIYLAARSGEQAVSQSISVLDAIDRIGQKHLPHLDTLAKLKLRSSLLVETAATYYRQREPFSAAMYVLAAFFIYPARNAHFFRTLWRSVMEVFGRERDQNIGGAGRTDIR